MNNKIFFVIWFPHSGGRWLNRGMLSRHSHVHMTEFFNPFLLMTTDKIMRLDTTEQVHKHRSIPDLYDEFEMVRSSVDYGRRQGIQNYFEKKIQLFSSKMSDDKILGGALPCGADIAHLDTKLLSEIFPYAKFIHLVRSPVGCFKSFMKRNEMDSDPYLISSYWARFNQHLRETLPADRYLQVIYENLNSGAENELFRICDFLEIKFESQMLDNKNKYFGVKDTRSGSLSKGILDIVDNVSSFEGVNYGY